MLTYAPEVETGGGRRRVNPHMYFLVIYALNTYIQHTQPRALYFFAWSPVAMIFRLASPLAYDQHEIGGGKMGE
jgi:hypothetical protein